MDHNDSSFFSFLSEMNNRIPIEFEPMNFDVCHPPCSTKHQYIKSTVNNSHTLSLKDLTRDNSNVSGIRSHTQTTRSDVADYLSSIENMSHEYFCDLEFSENSDPLSIASMESSLSAHIRKDPIIYVMTPHTRNLSQLPDLLESSIETLEDLSVELPLQNHELLPKSLQFAPNTSQRVESPDMFASSSDESQCNVVNKVESNLDKGDNSPKNIEKLPFHRKLTRTPSPDMFAISDDELESSVKSIQKDYTHTVIRKRGIKPDKTCIFTQIYVPETVCTDAALPSHLKHEAPSRSMNNLKETLRKNTAIENLQNLGISNGPLKYVPEKLCKTLAKLENPKATSGCLKYVPETQCSTLQNLQNQAASNETLIYVPETSCTILQNLQNQAASNGSVRYDPETLCTTIQNCEASSGTFKYVPETQFTQNEHYTAKAITSSLYSANYVPETQFTPSVLNDLDNATFCSAIDLKSFPDFQIKSKINASCIPEEENELSDATFCEMADENNATNCYNDILMDYLITPTINKLFTENQKQESQDTHMTENDFSDRDRQYEEAVSKCFPCSLKYVM